MIELAGIRAKIYAYLIDDDRGHKKKQGEKKMCHKTEAYV